MSFYLDYYCSAIQFSFLVRYKLAYLAFTDFDKNLKWSAAGIDNF